MYPRNCAVFASFGFSPRTGAPGDPVTHDFRENRVTIAIDPAGKVVEANCG